MSEYNSTSKENLFKEAEKVKTLEDLNVMFSRFSSMCHDYDSIVHASAAIAVAAFNAFNRGPQGGITGFQASFVGWDLVRHFMAGGNKTSLKLVDYDKMLYPQYRENFEKTIQKEVWEIIQKEAEKGLATETEAHPAVILHWRRIVDGIIPFGYTVKEEKR